MTDTKKAREIALDTAYRLASLTVGGPQYSTIGGGKPTIDSILKDAGKIEEYLTGDVTELSTLEHTADKPIGAVDPKRHLSTQEHNFLIHFARQLHNDGFIHIATVSDHNGIHFTGTVKAAKQKPNV